MAARLWVEGKRPNRWQRLLLNAAGVRARVLRGKDAKVDFTHLTEHKSVTKRPLAMWTRSADLLAYAGKGVPALLDGLGWHRSLTAEYTAPDAQLKLLLVADRGGTKPATWKNVIAISAQVARQQGAPEVARALTASRRTFERRPWDQLMPKDPQPLSLERITSKPTPVQLRQWLMTLGFYELYAGDGYTKQPDGARGVAEYVSGNRRVDSFEHRRVIDLGARRAIGRSRPPGRRSVVRDRSRAGTSRR